MHRTLTGKFRRDLFDLNEFVNDDDAADNADLTFTVNDGAASCCVQPGNDMVLLTYLPPGSKDTPAVDVIFCGRQRRLQRGRR